MYGPSAGTKKVAVVERWSLVEVRLSCHEEDMVSNILLVHKILTLDV